MHVAENRGPVMQLAEKLNAPARKAGARIVAIECGRKGDGRRSFRSPASITQDGSQLI